MDHDIRDFVRDYQNCQASKIQRHTKSPVVTIAPQSDRLIAVDIDIVGPLIIVFLCLTVIC